MPKQNVIGQNSSKAVHLDDRSFWQSILYLGIKPKLFNKMNVLKHLDLWVVLHEEEFCHMAEDTWKFHSLITAWRTDSGSAPFIPQVQRMKAVNYSWSGIGIFNYLNDAWLHLHVKDSNKKKYLHQKRISIPFHLFLPNPRGNRC